MEQLEDMFLTRLAEEKNISKPEAGTLVQKCITQVANSLNKNFKEVYAIFKTWGYQASYLKKACSSQTLEECGKMCYCVYYKNACHPRYIPEAFVINSNPEGFVEALSLKQLEDLADLASYLYYNYDGGGLTDNAFDAIEYKLKSIYKVTKKDYERNKVGAEPIEKLRVSLPYSMMSLDKLKPDNPELLPFLMDAKKTGLVCSEKLDGVSCLVVYSRADGIRMYTRGDGTTGGDVSYLRDYVKLPNVYSKRKFLAVRGELMMPKKVFDEKYKLLYSNPRSMVSAKVNQGFVSDSLKDIKFIAYQIVDTGTPEQLKPSQSFKLLEDLGFEVPYHITFAKPLLFDIVSLYSTRRGVSEYMIDGIVMAKDNPEELEDKNPVGTKAFKMMLDEQIRDTVVVDIEWNISRHGKYNPVAIFKPVYVDGMRYTRATAHNAKWVVDRHLGVGSRIRIIRSGDVIPQIKDVVFVDETIKPILPGNEVKPTTTYPWHWDERSAAIYVNDIEGNPIVKMKRLEHFVNIIGARGLGETRLQTIVDSGINQVKDLTQLGVDGLRKALGIKTPNSKLAQSAYDSIHEQMRKTRLSRFMVAMSTLKANIGPSIIRQLNRSFPDIYEKTEKEILARVTAGKPTGDKIKIPGIGPTRIPVIASGIPLFMEELKSLNKKDIEYAIKYQKERLKKLEKFGYNKLIQNKKFVLTGFMGKDPEDLIDYIWDHRGEVIGGAVSGADAVITNTFSNITDKMNEAKNLGIPVYTKEEFILMFDVPSEEVNIRVISVD